MISALEFGGRQRSFMGINGFGRIGRTVFKQLLQREELEVVGINDLTMLEDLAYLLKYDSVHGWYSRKVAGQNGSIQVDYRSIPFFSSADPRKTPGRKRERRLLSDVAGLSAAEPRPQGILMRGPDG